MDTFLIIALVLVIIIAIIVFVFFIQEPLKIPIVYLPNETLGIYSGFKWDENPNIKLYRPWNHLSNYVKKLPGTSIAEYLGIVNLKTNTSLNIIIPFKESIIFNECNVYSYPSFELVKSFMNMNTILLNTSKFDEINHINEGYYFILFRIIDIEENDLGMYLTYNTYLPSISNIIPETINKSLDIKKDSNLNDMNNINKKDIITPDMNINKKDIITPDMNINGKDIITPDMNINEKDIITPDTNTNKKDIITPDTNTNEKDIKLSDNLNDMNVKEKNIKPSDNINVMNINEKNIKPSDNLNEMNIKEKDIKPSDMNTSEKDIKNLDMNNNKKDINTSDTNKEDINNTSKQSDMYNNSNAENTMENETMDTSIINFIKKFDITNFIEIPSNNLPIFPRTKNILKYYSSFKIFRNQTLFVIFPIRQELNSLSIKIGYDNIYPENDDNSINGSINGCFFKFLSIEDDSDVEILEYIYFDKGVINENNDIPLFRIFIINE